MIEPAPRTWQRIVYEIERRGGAAALDEVMVASGFSVRTGAHMHASQLGTATIRDRRLYEEVRPVAGTRRLYLCLDDAPVDVGHLWDGREARSVWDRMMPADPYEVVSDGA